MPPPRPSPIVVSGVVALLVRLVFVWLHPVMAFGDGYARAVDPRQLLKSVWLPGYQLTLAVVSWFTRDPDAFRLLTVGQGALAAAAAAWAGEVWFGRGAGLVAGLAVAVFPTFVLTSTNLYQESLFLALALGAVTMLRQRRRGGLLLLGGACLVRYEGWLLAGFVVIHLLRARDWRRALAATVAPLAWIALVGSVSPLGLQSVDIGLSIDRIWGRAATMGALVAQGGGAGIALGAVAGAALGGRPAALVLAFGVVHLVWVAVLDPYSDPRHLRQIHVSLVVLALLAGAALQRFASPWARVAAGLALLLPCLWAWPRLVAGYAGGNEVLARAAGLAFRATPERRVLVLAAGVKGWPDATPDECLAVAAYAQAVDGVVCDSDTGSLDGIDAIVRIGVFPAWRPLHHQVEAGLGDGWVDLSARDDLSLWSTVPMASIAAPPVPPDQACRSALPATLRPDSVVIDGPLAFREADRLAFYGNGTLQWTAPSAGTLRMWICGTEADGQLPRVEVQIAEKTHVVQVGGLVRRQDVGPVEVGDRIELRYTDDIVDRAGVDRNLWVVGIGVE